MKIREGIATFKVVVVIIALSLTSVVFAQDLDLDEFEADVTGGIEKEVEVEVETKAADKSVDEDGEYEKIEVTGSHIKRIDIEGASPITVIDREALEKSGFNSVSDVLRQSTSSSFGGAREASGSNAAGVASVSLRGMGSDKTLVLLNGRRLPTDAVTAAVDLNLIPMAAVKRIEILKDGASATYGSDALGGVVNIITHKDFIGSEVSVRKSDTKIGGGEKEEVSFVTGSATSKSSVVTVIYYRNNANILSRSRSWSNYGESVFSPYPNVYSLSSGDFRGDTDCPTDRIDPSDGTTCLYNYAAESTEIPMLRQISGMTLFEYEVNPEVTLYGRFSATRKLSIWNYAPATLRASLNHAQMTALGPGAAYTGTTGGLIYYRTVELGNRVSEIETNAIGYQLGAKGSIGDSWEWDFSFDRNRVKRFDLGVSGYGSISKAVELMQAATFNPFTAAPTGTTRLDAAKFAPWEETVSSNENAMLIFSGELMDMPNGSGAIGGAVGFQYNEERFTDFVDAQSRSGDIFGSAGSNGQGDRNTKSAFMEIGVPVFDGLELQLAGRYDKFSDFGETTNPKVGLRWQINKKLMARASWGTGFKAPSMQELYRAQSEGNPTFIDQVACKQYGGADCKPKQYTVLSGGNTGLEEETSESYNVGLVFQHNKNISFGFDYWITKLNNVVGIDYEQMTLAESNGTNLSGYGINMQRRADNRIDKVTAPLLNLSARDVSGLDLTASAGGELGKLGFAKLDLSYSLLLNYEEESFPTTGFRETLQDNGRPAYRANATLTYVPAFHRDSAFQLNGNMIGTHFKAVRAEGKLDSYVQIDFNYTLQLRKLKGEFNVGMQNLFNKTPPLDTSDVNNQLNGDLYDPRGPIYYVGYKQNF